MTYEEYWYWLCNIKGLYRYNIKKLLDVFSAPEEIYKASEEELISSDAVDKKTVYEIIQAKNHFRPDHKLEKLKKDGIRFIYYGSKDYPEVFSHIDDYPYSFYLKGELPDPEIPAVGIVGSRTCSGYGKEMTLKFSQTLAANSVQIISGMALGIDSCASRGALEAGGKTFAVIGSGLDVIYPLENIELYYQIIMNGGGIISEYPMGSPPSGWHFPHRNRLISALSDKLLVMEARRRSGTSTTAAYALQQGKDIYALPGRVTDPLSEGCNRLIADGAGILTKPEYLLDEIYREFGSSWKDAPEKREDIPEEGSKKRAVYDALTYEPAHIKEIAEKSSVSHEKAAGILTEMELNGLCTEVSKDYYMKG